MKLKDVDDRIKIGDVWYVKEDQTTKAKAKEPFEIIYSKEMQITVDEFILVASVLGKDDKFAMPMIEKRPIDGEIMLECMDNEDWLLGVAERGDESIGLLDKDTPELNRAIITLCDEMKKLKWI